MPDSEYTRTPPPAQEIQILAIGDKVNDICENVKKLSELPQKIDRMSMQIEQINKDHEKTRSELERTKDHFEDDIERLKKNISDDLNKVKEEIKTNNKDISDALKPLVESKTKIDTVARLVNWGGMALILAALAAWSSLKNKQEVTQALSASTAQRTQVLEKNQDEGRAARLALTARVDGIQLEMYKRGNGK